MSQPRFVQIHFLTAYPGVLLNRDDVGLAKRLPFGGTSRIRISSQCLKRHWRTADGEHSLSKIGVPGSVRSRRIFEQEIAKPLIEEGFDTASVQEVLEVFMSNLLGESVKQKKSKKAQQSDKADLETSQIIVLGRPEIEYIKKLAKEALEAWGQAPKQAAEGLFKRQNQNLEALRKAGMGLDAALFGRMVTSDALARGDAAVHVAHAFTVHAEEAESDYFTAVDDLLSAADELGSAHLGETELTSGLFYGYVVLDVPLLVSNLEGCERKDWAKASKELAAKVAEHLVHLIAETSPGAKLGSTAPYSYAQLVLAEVGSRQPRTLANAFLEPVPADGKLLQRAIFALRDYLARFDAMYGKKEKRKVSAMFDLEGFPADECVPLGALAQWVAEEIRSAS